MEPHSRTDDTPRSRAILEGQLREQFGRVVYTHKTQEKCADILLARQSAVRYAQIGLSAVSAAGFIAGVFGVGPWANIIGLTVSTVLLALNTYVKDYNMGEIAQKHRQAAAELWYIREQFESLLVDIAMGERPLESMQDHRDKLTKELYELYKTAPSTNGPAYAKAQDALKNREDMTFSDSEIDAFLPKELKRTTAKSAPPAAS